MRNLLFHCHVCHPQRVHMNVTSGFCLKSSLINYSGGARKWWSFAMSFAAHSATQRFFAAPNDQQPTANSAVAAWFTALLIRHWTREDLVKSNPTEWNKGWHLSTYLLASAQSLVDVDMHKLMIQLFTPSGNQTWQWKIPYEWRFLARKILDKWSIFRHAMFDDRRAIMILRKFIVINGD